MASQGKTVLGAHFQLWPKRLHGGRHIGFLFYKLASAGRPSVFQPLCWKPDVGVPLEIGAGCLGLPDPDIILTLVHTTSKPWWSRDYSTFMMRATITGNSFPLDFARKWVSGAPLCLCITQHCAAPRWRPEEVSRRPGQRRSCERQREWSDARTSGGQSTRSQPTVAELQPPVALNSVIYAHSTRGRQREIAQAFLLSKYYCFYA